jgi:hypothetical protein
MRNMNHSLSTGRVLFNSVMNQRFWWWPEVRKHYSTANCDWGLLSNWLSVTIFDSTRQSMYVRPNTEAHSCNHCSSRKATILLILSVFADLCIQHAMRMRHIVTCVLSGTRYFPTLSLKQHDFRMKVFEHEICVLIFSTNLSQTTSIQRRFEGDIFILVRRSSCKAPFILLGF